MAKIVLKDVSGIEALLEERFNQTLLDNAVPLLDEAGNVTGKFYDRRFGPPPEAGKQPGTERTAALVDFMREKYPNAKFTPGRPLHPEFDPVDVFESEGILESIINTSKLAFEESLTGAATKLARGKPTFDLSHFQPSKTEQVAAQIASFFMPADLAVLMVGGGAGGVVGKKVLTGAVNRYVQKQLARGLTKKVAQEVARDVSESIAKKAATVATSGGALAAFGGTGEALRQLNAGERDFLEIFKESTNEAIKGGILGTAVGLGGALIPPSVGRIGAEAGHVAAGTAAFGVGAPLLEGQVPTFEGIKDAAVFMVGLRAAQRLIKLGIGDRGKAIKKAQEELEVEVKKGKTLEEAVQERVSLPEERIPGVKRFKEEAPLKAIKEVKTRLEVVMPEETDAKSLFNQFRKASNVARKRGIDLYVPKEFKGTPLFEALKRQGRLSKRPTKSGSFKVIKKLPAESNRQVFEKAFKEGKIDEGTLKMGRFILNKSPELEVSTVFKISDIVKRVSNDVVKAENLPESKFAAEVGRTTTKTRKGIASTTIELFKGADAETVVHEWYHEYWNRLPAEVKETYKGFHEKGKSKKSVDEAFADDGTAFFFSEKLKADRGVLRRFFDKARAGLGELIKGVRRIRGVKIPKEIRDIFRREELREVVKKRAVKKRKVTEKREPERKPVKKRGVPTKTVRGDSVKEGRKKPKKEVKINKQIRILDSVAAKKVGHLEQFKERARRLTPKVLFQLKNRFKTEPGKSEFVPNINTVSERHHVIAGSGNEALSKEGIGVKSKKYPDGEVVKDLLEKGDPSVAGIRKVLDDIHDMALKAGIPIGKIKNYFPRTWRREIAEVIHDDVRRIRKELPEAETASDKAVLDAVSRRGPHKIKIKGKTVSVNVGELLEYMRKNNKQFKTLRSALNALDREVQGQLFPRASFEKPRKLKIPSQYFESDAHKALPRYVEIMSERIAQAEVWGSKGEKWTDLYRRIQREDPEEAALALKSLSISTGKYQVEHGFTGLSKNLVDAFIAMQFGTKIGLGRATLLNLTQAAISVIPDLGFFNTIRGGMALFNPETRSFVRRSGVIKDTMMEAMTGYVPEGIWGQFSKQMSKFSGFTAVNRGLQYLSASTLRTVVPEWVRMSKGTGKRAEWAKQRLKDFNLDKGITEDKLLRAMVRFATDAQLQKNIMNDPLFFNLVKARPLVLFKRFGFRQFTFMKDMLVRETKRGNYMPMLRLATAGFLGGEMIHWGLNQIYSTLSGEPQFRKDDSLVERAINNMTIIGAFGMMSDMAELDQISRLGNQIKFTVYPVLISDFEKVIEASTRVLQDWEKYGNGFLVTQRNAYSVLGFLGSYPRQLGKRLLTDAQKKRRIASGAGREIKDIIELQLEGNGRAASKRIEQWNKHHDRESQIGIADVNMKAIRKFLDRKMRSFIEAKGDISASEKARLNRKMQADLRTARTSGR